MKEYLNGFLVFIAVVVVPIVIHSMIVYGKTNENIDEQYFLGYSIGDDFNDLPNDRKTIIKTGYIGNFSIASYSDRIVYTLEDDEDAKGIWEYYIFENEEGKIKSYSKVSLPIYHKKEAKEIMSKISKSLSDKYTKGKGLRAYKRNRNFVYNKKQGIMMEICLEREYDYYTVNVYFTKYSWISKIWKGFYWSFISSRRPGFNIADIIYPHEDVKRIFG